MVRRLSSLGAPPGRWPINQEASTRCSYTPRTGHHAEVIETECQSRLTEREQSAAVPAAEPFRVGLGDIVAVVIDQAELKQIETCDGFNYRPWREDAMCVELEPLTADRQRDVESAAR